MDNNTTERPEPPVTITNTDYPNTHSSNPKRFLLIGAVLILALALGIGGFAAGRFTDILAEANQPKAPLVSTPSNWQKLPSNKKGFPIPNRNEGPLTYYSFDKGKVVTVDTIKTSRGDTGAIGKGGSAPTASPDLRYITFIGDDDNLWLFSNETEQTKQLTKNGFVSHITNWSPDSKKILYYLDRKTISSSSGVVDGPTPTTISFKPQFEQGFYQIDIETGKVTPLAALEHVEGYVNNTTLLVKSSYESPRFATFKLDTFQADLSLVDVKSSLGVGQFDFSPDGKQWAYTDTTNSDDPTKGKGRIVLGAFPETATTVVDFGAWGEAQWPIFSPDSKKIVYQKRVGQIEGIPQNHIWVYDVESGAKTDIGEGAPVLWTDDNMVLIRVQESSIGAKARYALLNSETRQVTPLQ